MVFLENEYNKASFEQLGSVASELVTFRSRQLDTSRSERNASRLAKLNSSPGTSLTKGRKGKDLGKLLCLRAKRESEQVEHKQEGNSEIVGLRWRFNTKTARNDESASRCARSASMRLKTAQKMTLAAQLHILDTATKQCRDFPRRNLLQGSV